MSSSNYRNRHAQEKPNHKASITIHNSFIDDPRLFEFVWRMDRFFVGGVTKIEYGESRVRIFSDTNDHSVIRLRSCSKKSGASTFIVDPCGVEFIKDGVVSLFGLFNYIVLSLTQMGIGFDEAV